MTLTKDLYQKLWNSADILRSNMDASEYKSYLLGLIFYKYLSDKQLEYVGELMEVEDLSLESLQDVYEETYDSEDGEELVYELNVRFSYVIKPAYTYTKFIEEIDDKSFELEHLDQGFRDIEQASKDFENMFEDVDLYSKRLGSSLQRQNETISKVMKEIASLDLSLYSGDVLGDVYEYMIGQFATESGKKAGEFYTPQQVSSLMAKIAMDGKEDIKGFTVYDPTMGFRVIIVIEANSYVNTRSSRLLPKFKTQKINSWCAA
ncbi:MAG: class I SAM-dependent DNA methyltransferase [Anaerococcus sp.]|nr:class I SAM-dependent DNA methyltransferase [Anaerococcus sp.]